MELRLPGDKSISHRALMLASLAQGISRLRNLSNGADVVSTRTCLEKCGISIKEEGDEVIVDGQGGIYQSPDTDLDAGNSGTTARLLTGLLAGRNIHAKLTGDTSLSRRPMSRIVEPLCQMGAMIHMSPRGTLPIILHPAELGPLDYTLPVASAQVKSALLLAGLASKGTVAVTELMPSRNHTELMLQALGVDVQVSGNQIVLKPGVQTFPPFEMDIPGDISSAAFPAALAVLLPDIELTFKDLLLNPSRMGFMRVLQRMGARISWSVKRHILGEEVGDLSIHSSNLESIQISGAEIPMMIDEIPMLAILATQANGATVVRDAGELRVKECDRIKAICENLKRMGARVQELTDGFRVWGPVTLRGATIRTQNDHRIAMTFAVASKLAVGRTVLDNPRCVEVSFPGFFDVIERLSS